MHDPDIEESRASLRDIRRRLAVVYLAVEQLCRKVAAFPPAQRLCSIAVDALRAIKDDVAAMEARLTRRERGREALPDQFPEHPPAP